MKIPKQFSAIQKIRYQQNSWDTTPDMVTNAMDQDMMAMDHSLSASAQLMKADLKLKQKRYLGAYLEAIEALKIDPRDFRLQNEFSNFKKYLHEHLIKLSWSNPSDPEIGSIYEVLESIGYHSIESLSLSAMFFNLIGENNKAQDILSKITALFPNAFFVSELRDRKHSNSEPSVVHFSPLNTQPLNMKLVRKKLEAINDIYSQLDPENAGSALAKINDFIGKDSLNEENREFFYTKAICLDYTQQPLEALDLLLELTRRFPSIMQYRLSLEIVLTRLQNYASAMADEDPDNEVLISYFEILSEYHFCEVPLVEKAAMQYLKKGNKQRSDEMIKGLLAIFPNTPYVLNVGLQYFILTEDLSEVRALETRINKLQQKYYYDALFF